MAQRAIREYDAKKILENHWKEYIGKEPTYNIERVLVTPETDLDTLSNYNSNLIQKQLVVKPDQLFGKRGQHNLILKNAHLDQVIEWIKDRMKKKTTVGNVTDELTHFIIEEYFPHEHEYYIAIKSERENDHILFSSQGGIEIESLWDTVTTMKVSVLEDIEKQAIWDNLPQDLPHNSKQVITDFIKGLFEFFRDMGFTYLEINPFTISRDEIIPLDLVARIDDTAYFQSGKKWGNIEFPPPLSVGVFHLKKNMSKSLIKKAEPR